MIKPFATLVVKAIGVLNSFSLYPQKDFTFVDMEKGSSNSYPSKSVWNLKDDFPIYSNRIILFITNL